MVINNYLNSAGKWRSKEKRVSNQREASKVIAQLRAEIAQSSPGSLDGEKMTIEQLLAKYKEEHPNKPQWYIDPIEEFFKGRRIRTITPADCARFKASREAIKDKRYKKPEEAPPRAPATIHRELEELRAVLLYALDNEWILKNPFKRRRGARPLIDKKEERRRDVIPTPEQEEKILAVCVPPRAHLRGLVIATLDTGLRRSALQVLTWSCVDFENHVISVPRGNRYKNRPKMVGLTARLEAELRDLLAQSHRHREKLREKGDPLPDLKNEPIFGKTKDFKRSWRTACKLAGVEGLRFNDLRHGFSTGMMEAGVPKDLAMKIAAHSNEEIHDIYTNIDQRLARQAAEALDKLHGSRTLQPTEANELPN